MSPKTAKGVTFSLISSVFFGVLWFIMPNLAPMTGAAIWAIRVLFAVPTITLVLLISREWPMIGEMMTRLRKKPWLALGMLATSLLLATQIWIYMWAPLNGRGLQVALGYFMFPLVMIVVGRALYGDRLTRLQLVATIIAVLGVLAEIIRVGSISWEALVVCLGYPAYFVLRRYLGLNNTVGMWFDMLLVVPLATFVLFNSIAYGPSLIGATQLSWLAPVIGVSSSVAVLLFVLAGKYLSLSVFGLLSYMEPALLMIAAVLIGETIAQGELIIYIAIWSAIALVIIDGILQIRGGRANTKAAADLVHG